MEPEYLYSSNFEREWKERCLRAHEPLVMSQDAANAFTAIMSEESEIKPEDSKCS